MMEHGVRDKGSREVRKEGHRDDHKDQNVPESRRAPAGTTWDPESVDQRVFSDFGSVHHKRQGYTTDGAVHTTTVAHRSSIGTIAD